MAKPSKVEREKGEVYGFLLTIRCLEAFAVRWPEYPATLRVLTVLAAYMNQDGECRVSRFTLADRLGMSRQAVQQHLSSLREKTIIAFNSETGSTTRFRWHPEYAKECAIEREGQNRVIAARAHRKSQRKAARRTSRPPQVQANDLAPVPEDSARGGGLAAMCGGPPAGASSDLAGGASPSLAAGASSDLAGGASQSACTKKPSFKATKESFEREGACAPASPVGSPGAAPLSAGEFAVGDRVLTPAGGEVVAILEGVPVETVSIGGDKTAWAPDGLRRERVFHAKFGMGTVVIRNAEENLVTVNFDRAGQKRVHADYVQAP
jgi:hypothetical protein